MCGAWACHMQDFSSQLCVLEGGEGALLDLLLQLKALRFKLLLLENREVFKDTGASACVGNNRACPCRVDNCLFGLAANLSANNQAYQAYTVLGDCWKRFLS